MGSRPSREPRLGLAAAGLSAGLMGLALVLGGCPEQPPAETPPQPKKAMVLDREVDHTAPAAGARELSLVTHRGSLTVRTRPGTEARVSGRRAVKSKSAQDAEKWLRMVKLRVERDGGAIEVEDVWPPGPLPWDGPQAGLQTDLTVEVPPGLAATITSGVGSISLQGEFRSLGVQAGVGDVSGQVQSESLEVEVGTGEVTLSGGLGRVSVQTGAGRLRLQGELSEGVLESDSGDVTLSDLRCTGPKLRVTTGSGAVNARLTALPAQALNLSTGSGKIILAAPLAPAGFQLEARTGSGRVQSTLPLEVSRDSTGNLGEALVATYGNGQCAVTLQTGSGDITIGPVAPRGEQPQ